MKAHPDGLITLKPAKTNRGLQGKLVHNKVELTNLECKKNAIELPEHSVKLMVGLLPPLFPIASVQLVLQKSR